jgi:PHP domain
LAQPKGARFVRADLHIHSFGASHDVRDQTMTPGAIVATAVREGLGIIAVSDHNEIGNVEGTLQAALAAGVCAIPGVELSTSQGHLLCYLPTIEAMRSPRPCADRPARMSFERGDPPRHLVRRVMLRQLSLVCFCSSSCVGLTERDSRTGTSPTPHRPSLVPIGANVRSVYPPDDLLFPIFRMLGLLYFPLCFRHNSESAYSFPRSVAGAVLPRIQFK